MSNDAEPLPVARMNEGVPPGRAQYENWRAGAKAAYEFVALDGPESFEGQGYGCPLMDVVATHTHRTGGISLRNEEHIRESGPVYWLQRYLKGSERIYCGAETYLMEPGKLALLDMRLPSVTHGGAMERQTLVIPAKHIQDIGESENQICLRVFNQDTPHGRLLHDAMDELFLALPRSTMAEAPGLHEYIIELLNALLTREPTKKQSARIRAAMFVSMKRYLHARLEEPQLGAENLCATFHCSRATVYRLFAPVGGIQRYLRDQRLIKTCEDLAAPTPEKKTIREIAERWGFDDPSHFNHLFKDAFGVTPGEAMRRAPKAPPEVAETPAREGDIARFQGWMRDR